MARINIIRLDGTPDTAEESALLRRGYVAEEDDDKRVDVVEYCWLGCDGGDHGPSPCQFHVHRSVTVTIKRMTPELQAIVAQISKG